MTENTIAGLRERMAVLEVQHKNLSEDLAETRIVLHTTNSALTTLTRQLDAITNQGRGVGLVVKGILALGGLGWIGGIYAFFQTFLQK